MIIAVLLQLKVGSPDGKKIHLEDLSEDDGLFTSLQYITESFVPDGSCCYSSRLTIMNNNFSALLEISTFKICGHQLSNGRSLVTEPFFVITSINVAQLQ